MANEELRKSNMTDVSSPAEDAPLDASSQVQDAVQVNEGSQVQSPVSTDSGASAEEGMLEESTFRGEGMTYLTDDPTLDAEEEETKRRIVITPRMIKLGTALVFSMIILIFATIAWFTMNRDVGTSKMGVKSATLPFELAAKGTSIRYENEFKKATSSYATGSAVEIDNETYYVLGAGSDGAEGIMLRFDGNASSSGEIAPGGNGELRFYIIPKIDGNLELDIDLKVTGCYAWQKPTGEMDDEDAPVYETKVIEMQELTTDNSDLSDGDITKKKEAESYLQGHIMFFAKKNTPAAGQDEPAYYYKEPITGGVYHLKLENVETDKPEEVTIYWMWPNTLGQIALKNNDSKFRNGIPVVEDVDTTPDLDSDKGLVIKYLKDNKEKVFANSNDVTDTIIDNADTKANFDLLSSGYNSADLKIGENVSYFLIEIEVKAK